MTIVEENGIKYYVINENLKIYDLNTEENTLIWSADYNEDVYTQTQVENLVEETFNNMVDPKDRHKAWMKQHAMEEKKEKIETAKDVWNGNTVSPEVNEFLKNRGVMVSNVKK